MTPSIQVPAEPSPSSRHPLQIVLWTTALGFGLLLTAGLLTSRYVGHREPSGDTARCQMLSFGKAIELYVLENGALPPSLETLTQPSRKSSSPILLQVPTDPWKRPYRYRIVDPARRVYVVSCAGEDGEFGTDDDLVEPEPAGSG